VVLVVTKIIKIKQVVQSIAMIKMMKAIHLRSHLMRRFSPSKKRRKKGRLRIEKRIKV